MQGYVQDAEQFFFGESPADSLPDSTLVFASGSCLSRAFGVAGSDCVIENGRGEDIVHCGAAGLMLAREPAEVGFVLSSVFVHSLIQQIGESRLTEFTQQPAPQRSAGR